MRIALPRFGESVAPCFEQTSTITIFTIRRKRILSQEDFVFKSREGLDRVRLLRDQGVDVLICGGMQEVFEMMLTARGIQVYSWVSGNVDDLIGQYLAGTLVPGTARIASIDPSDHRTTSTSTGDADQVSSWTTMTGKMDTKTR